MPDAPAVITPNWTPPSPGSPAAVSPGFTSGSPAAPIARSANYVAGTPTVPAVVSPGFTPGSPAAPIARSASYAPGTPAVPAKVSLPAGYGPIMISGITSPDVSGLVIPSASPTGPGVVYSTDGAFTVPLSGKYVTVDRIQLFDGSWRILRYTDGVADSVNYFTNPDDAAKPDLCDPLAWVFHGGATGPPVLTAVGVNPPAAVSTGFAAPTPAVPIARSSDFAPGTPAVPSAVSASFAALTPAAPIARSSDFTAPTPAAPAVIST